MRTIRRAAAGALITAALVLPLGSVPTAGATAFGGDEARTLDIDLGAALARADVGILAPPPGFHEIRQDFYVQNRTGRPLGERYTLRGGVHTTRVFAGEERVEMRWDDWPNQRREHMWEGQIRIQRGSGRVCVMQIKSNRDGEPIYIQLIPGSGDLRNNGDREPVARSMWGRWFTLRASFNPATGVARAWIDGRLVKTRQYRTPTSGWYFKNGTYNNGIPSGGRAVAEFRNIHIYQHD